jgi:hypothetical protein
MRYVVTVYTSDVRGAGTDSRVTLQLHGTTEVGDQLHLTVPACAKAM